MKKLTHLLLALASTFTYGQTNLFTPIDITEEDLVGQQIVIFDMLMAQGVYSSYQFVTTNYDAFEDDNGIVSVDLSEFVSEPSYLFRTSNIEWNDLSNFNWYGNYHGYNDTTASHFAEMFLVRHDNKLIGNINLDTLAFEIYDLTEDVQIILEKNLSLFEGDFCPMDDQNAGELYNKTDPCEVFTLKILFILTGEVVEPDPIGKATLVVLQLNTIYRNSDVRTSNAVLANVVQTGLTQTSNHVFDIGNWSTDPSIEYLRYQNHADIVVFLTAPTYGDINGWAKVNGAEPEDAYCLVTAITATDSRYVGAHEITNLMGGVHHNDVGDYRGYDFYTGLKHRYTIMSKKNVSKPRIAHVSNPGILFKDKPTGNSSHRVADIVNDRYDYLAQEYPESPLNIYAKFDFIDVENCELERTITALPLCGKAPFSYQWQKSFNGINWYSLSTLNSASITFNMPTPYPINAPFSSLLVRCTVTDDNGATYVVQSTENYFCDPAMNKTSLENQLEQNPGFKVFPNPTSGNFTIEMFANQSCDRATINVYNATGQQVYAQLFRKIAQGINLISVDLKSLKLPDGLYFIVVETDTELSRQPLIIK